MKEGRKGCEGRKVKEGRIVKEDCEGRKEGGIVKEGRKEG